MSSRSVLKRGNPLLNQVCTVVSDIKSAKPIISELCETLSFIQSLYEFKRGCGIAAPQIGHLLRINVVEYEGQRLILINPEIVKHSPNKVPIKEGCLSFFDYRGNVPRYESVVVQALDEHGKQQTIEASGNFAMVLQHEIDHLNGILFVQYLENLDNDLRPVDGMPRIP